MKPVPKAGPVYVLLGVALLSATFGCVEIARYRQMSITVHDDSTGLPVAHAHVTIQSGVPEMKWNTGKIPVFQFGATDAKGEWKVTYYTKHNGACGVQCPGYKDKVLTIDDHTFDDGTLDVRLTPVPRTTEAAKGML